MSNQKKPVSNLEYLASTGVLPEGTTLNDAVCILTDPLNCVECIAVEQCTDRYGGVTGELNAGGCLEVISAYLKQDHKEAKVNGNG